MDASNDDVWDDQIEPISGFTFNEIFRSGYDQAVIDDKASLLTALDVISYLSKRNRELEALVADLVVRDGNDD